MHFQFYLEKLIASPEFNEFMSEHRDAFCCSGFFVVDREKSKVSQDKQHFDYFVPSEKKMYSFSLEDGVKKIPVEMYDESVPEKISLDYDYDFDNVEKIINERMVTEKTKGNVTKILYSMQHLDGKDYLVGTVFLSMLGMLRVHYDIEAEELVLFEKKSFMDMLQITKKKKDEELHK